MYEFTLFQLFLVILLFATISGVVAYLARGQVGEGKDQQAKIAQLEAELAELKEQRTEVSNHFHETADLLNDMTRQYKTIYEHMAAGANKLCEESEGIEVLERLQTGLLPKENLITADITDTIETDSKLSSNEKI